MSECLCRQINRFVKEEVPTTGCASLGFVLHGIQHLGPGIGPPNLPRGLAGLGAMVRVLLHPERTRQFLGIKHGEESVPAFLFAIKYAPAGSPLRLLCKNTARLIGEQMQASSHLSCLARLLAALSEGMSFTFSPNLERLIGSCAVADTRLHGTIIRQGWNLEWFQYRCCWICLSIHNLIQSHTGKSTAWCQPERVLCCEDCFCVVMDWQTLSSALQFPAHYRYPQSEHSPKYEDQLCHGCVLSSDTTESSPVVRKITHYDGTEKCYIPTIDAIALRNKSSHHLLGLLKDAFPTQHAAFSQTWTLGYQFDDDRASTLARLPAGSWSHKSVLQEFDSMDICRNNLRVIGARVVPDWQSAGAHYVEQVSIYERARDRRHEWLLDNPPPTLAPMPDSTAKGRPRDPGPAETDSLPPDSKARKDKKAPKEPAPKRRTKRKIANRKRKKKARGSH